MGVRAQTAVCFEFGNHGPQSIHVCFQEDGILRILPPKIHQYAALDRLLGGNPKAAASCSRYSVTSSV